MRLILSLFVALFLGASSAQAQIIAVHFKDAKAAKKYKDYLVEYKGEMVVIGEIKGGFKYVAETHTLSYQPQGSNELFISDRKKPQVYPYYLVDGKKKEASKKNKLMIQGGQIARLSIVMRDQTLPGLTTEYILKREQIDEYRALRDGYEEGSSEWLAAHHRMVTYLERFEGWLQNVGFTGVIKNVQKEIKKEKKEVRDAALEARAQRAQDSIEGMEVPPELLRVSEEKYGGKHVYHALKSAHFRIYYLTEGNVGGGEVISDEEARRLLELAERILDGFRAEFVDPYRGDDFKNTIPDNLVATWLFTPSPDDIFVPYLKEMYGYRRNKNAEQGEAKGTTMFGGFPTHHRFNWRLAELDLRGIICHNMGHMLAMRHYGGGRGGMNQDWLEEAVGNQISYQYLGRNNVNCLGVKEKPTYLKREVAKPGEKTMAVGRRAVYNEMALSQGSPMQQIALKKLIELNDADLAKSWSFYDYITRREGKEGQLWLRAAGEYSRNRNTFIANWRKAAAEILGVNERQAFTVIEDRWRQFAEHGQMQEDD